MKNLKFLVVNILLCLTISQNSFSQTNLDSLWRIWEDESQHDTLRLEAMSTWISDAHLHSQPDSAIHFAEVQYDFANSNSQDKWKMIALSTKGQAYYVKADFYNAKDYTEQSLVLAEKIGDDSGIANTNNTLGLIYQSQNDYEKAIEFFTKSLELYEHMPESDDRSGGMGSALTNLGVIYYNLDDPDQAMNFYTRSLKLQTSANDKRNMANTISNMGMVYAYQGYHEKELEYNNRAYALHKEVGNLNSACRTLMNIGNSHAFRGDFEKALLTFEETLDLATTLGNPDMISKSKLALGQVYLSLNQINKSLSYKKEALEIAQESGNLIPVLEAAGSLSGLYQSQGDYKNALEYFQLYILSRDSLNNSENRRALVRQEYQYNYDKKVLADSIEFAQKETITNLQLEKNEATLSQQRLALIATILGLLLLGALAYFFYQSKKRQEAEANRVKELDAFKSTFYTNITHEFRTPLTVILGMAKQIEERPQQYLDEGIKLIKRNGKNLLGQINQILDLSKLETNSLQLNIIQGDVIEFLRYSTEAFQSYANGQNLSLRFFSPVEKLQMDYDPDTIQNIMSNLISNAMKFTPSGGDVKVLLENDDEQLIIKVQDSGVGISEKDLPHIFDRFYQVENLNGSEVYGTGVGLAYVQELVKVIEGNISVKSEVGKGTTFIVNLPIKRKAAIAENGISKVETQTWKPIQKRVDVVGDTKISSSKIDSTLNTNENLPNLLIIEDNADVVIYLKSCLSDLYQIEVAYNGKIGIEKALETIPDLIISDVMMPEKDGFEVCDVLKNDEKTSHIPLILLTAKADSSSKIVGLKRGADAYLSKPFDKEELLVRLEMLVERQKKMVTYFSQKNQTNGKLQTIIEVEEAIQIEDIFIQKVKTIIEENYSDEGFALPQLCQKIGMSRSQLFRKMKALINTSPSDFIRTYRLEKAKALLETTEMNVSEVSWEVGFKDVSHFSKSFQNAFGHLPSQESKSNLK